MHRLGARRLAGVDDQLGLEVGFRRRRGAEPDALVGHADMRRAGVGIGIDRDRLDPHPLRGADDAAGDFPAIGDQDFLEHQCPELDHQLRSRSRMRDNSIPNGVTIALPGQSLTPCSRVMSKAAIAAIRTQLPGMNGRQLLLTPPPRPSAACCGRAGAAPRPPHPPSSCPARRSPAPPPRAAWHSPAAG